MRRVLENICRLGILSQTGSSRRSFFPPLPAPRPPPRRRPKKRKDGDGSRHDLSLEFLNEQIQRQMIKQPDPRGAISPCTNLFCEENEMKWCAFPTQVEFKDWQRLFSARPNLMKLVRSQETDMFKKYVLPDGFKVMHVSGRKAVERSMHLLAESMTDPVLAIDLEWAGKERPVGIIQIASASMCVLIRAKKYWRNTFLPPHLATLVTNPNVVIVGFGWERADELKMRKSFNWGRSNFNRFVDLQEVAKDMGYGYHLGLGDLTERVLGVKLAKDITIQRSDWEAEQLKRPQVLYAALDVFSTGHVFRTLRAWHATRSHVCSVCNHTLGELFLGHTISCKGEGCRRVFRSAAGFKSHCEAHGHPFHDPVCIGCGRIVSRKPRKPEDGNAATDSESMESSGSMPEGNADLQTNGDSS
ncbi:hypothetical protein BSKO_03524 [Bryopsis sp. KO-2023]|nr:hypothetical protein BSKO_03524 [Bryopsis sp. KO-2023]